MRIYYVYPKVSGKQIFEAEEFIKSLFPIKEIKFFNNKNKFYKSSKLFKVSEILIELEKPLKMTNWEAFKFVYIPIYRVIFKRNTIIYKT
ncbi:MAG: hypothetical protein RMJ17_02240 [Candidatus Aenigmarchaeota archaeon]|nr:hypothetical protein [Candidatus Aenigmarchaeota archaeon]MDW8149392.1 hypothetical protein [Candidatus Aenigmarchaeota archaeon]